MTTEDKDTNYIVQFATTPNSDKHHQIASCRELTTETPTIETDCAKVLKLLDRLSSSKLKLDFEMQREYLNKMLQIWKSAYCIKDASDLVDNSKIDGLADDVLTKLKSVERLYIDELEMYINIVENIFSIVNQSQSIGTVVWATKYKTPVYVILENISPLYPNIAYQKLLELLSEIGRSAYIIRKLPNINDYNPMFNKCSGLEHRRGLLDIENLNIMLPHETVSAFIDIGRAYPSLAPWDFRGGSSDDDIVSVSSAYRPAWSRAHMGLGRVDDDLCKDEKDECIIQEEIASDDNPFTQVARLSAYINGAHTRVIYAIFRTMDTLDRVSGMLKRIARILDIFMRANMLTYEGVKGTGTSSSILFKKTIIEFIDINFLKFLVHLLVEQLKTDKYDQFSIERILLNVVNNYVTMSPSNKPYIYIKEQTLETQANIILILSIFSYILSNVDFFYIPPTMTTTICLPYLFAMTNRDRIVFPNEQMRSQTIKYVMSLAENMFTWNGVILKPLNGYDIIIEVDESVTNIELYKK